MQKASLTLRVTIAIAASCFMQTTYEYYYVKKWRCPIKQYRRRLCAAGGTSSTLQERRATFAVHCSRRFPLCWTTQLKRTSTAAAIDTAASTSAESTLATRVLSLLSSSRVEGVDFTNALEAGAG